MASWLPLPHQTPGPEKISATHHAKRHLRIDRVLGNAQALRHLAMRQAIDFAEGEHPPAALGENADGLMKQRKFVSMVDSLGDTGPILYHGQAFDFS